MNTIKINCPNCEESIEITLIEDFEVQSIKLNQIELSEQEQIEALREHGIELG